MHSRSIFAILLAGTLGVVTLSPALAAKHEKAKATGACAQPSNRCISDCDALNWCTMNICTNGVSTPVPVWRCFEPSGFCLAPHC
jgi:hypothetical protein